MKLFERTPGYYLFWTGLVYFCVGMYDAFVDRFAPLEQIQAVWIFVLCLPFSCPPLGRWFGLSVDWDIKMFNWFKGKTAKEYLDDAKADSNVVKFPDHREYGVDDKQALPLPQAQTPKKEEPTKIFYRLGLTDNNRVAFSMGYSEITLNKEGCQQMIDQLKFFQSQLQEE